MKHITKIFALLAITTLCTACFKDEVQGTLLKIAGYSQDDTESDIVPTTADFIAYAFYVDKGEKWMVASWQDAIDMKITNVDNPSKVLSGPDVIGTFDKTAEYQICLDLDAKYTSLVVVDMTNKIYAYRDYETPMNLPETLTQLHLYAWKSSGSACGWTTVKVEEESAE